MPHQYLLLVNGNPANNKGLTIEIEPPLPLREGGPPRPFRLGAPGKNFDIGIETDQNGKSYGQLQRSAEKGGTLGYELLYAEGYVRREATASFRLNSNVLSEAAMGNVYGHSGDLLFALAVIIAAMPKAGDYPPFAATGILNQDGRVQSVEGIPAKLHAALAVVPAGGRIFYPLANDPEIGAVLRKTALANKIELIPVERLDEAVSVHFGITVEKAWIGPPYRRLESFTAQDRRIFFGRESDVVSLAEKLIERERRRSPGVLILGASGLGKSSLVQAGLLPHFKQTLTDRSVVYDIWRPGAAENFDQSGLADSIRRRWSHLPELMRLAHDRCNPPDTNKEEPLPNATPLQQLAADLSDKMPSDICFLFVLNQMEELFTPSIPAAILTALCAFLHQLQTLGVWVIGTLRSEYYHPFAQQKDLLDMFGDDGVYNLRELNATSLERVIRGPAELSGLQFENDAETGHNLALQLRDDAMAGGANILPLLEVTLDLLYERRDVDRGLLTFKAYREIEGLQGAVGTHAEKVFIVCSKEERAVLSEVLGRLVRLSADGALAMRQRARVRNFRADKAVTTLLEKLIAERLLTSERDQNDEPVVELAHDSLLVRWPVVSQAIEEHRDLLEEKRKLTNAAKHWEEEGKPRRFLIGKAKQVLDAEVLVACLYNDIDPCTQTFLQESIRLTRTGFWLFWLFLTITIFVGVLSIPQDHFANKNTFVTITIEFLFAFLFALLPFFMLIRSLRPKPYLATARVDLILSYGYLCFLLFISIRFFPRNVPTFMSFDYVIRWIIALAPPCLVVQNIIIKQQALKAIWRKRIKKKPPIRWLFHLPDLFPSSVWTWQKVEVAGFTFFLITLYVSVGSTIDQGYKASADDLSAAHNIFAEQSLQRGEIDNAQQRLNRAREILRRFMDAKRPSSDGENMKWHDENMAVKLTPILLNGCRLRLLTKEPLESIKDCQLAAEISRYWINQKTEKHSEWQNNLAVALSKEGLAHFELKNVDRAMAVQVEAKQQLERLLQSTPDSNLYQANLAIVLKRIGDIHNKSGNKKLAQDAYLKARQKLESIMALNDSGLNVAVTNELLSLYTNLATVAKELSDPQTRRDALQAAENLLENAKQKELQALWVNQPLANIRQQLEEDHSSQAVQIKSSGQP
ncbi:MAG: hypothetical protein ACRESZ_04640 [Methylococcales bacterium]